MKITKRQLRRIVKEERARIISEQEKHRGNPNKPWDYFFPPGSVSKAGPNPEHELGKKIEEAIALAQKLGNKEVLASLEEAHEALMGY